MSTYLNKLRADLPWSPEGPFHSRDELSAAMGSPRYRYDAVYRQQVADKLASTDRVSWELHDHRQSIQATWTDPSAPQGDGPSW